MERKEEERGRGGATRPRDLRPGRRALGDREAYCARASECACMRARLSAGTPRAGAARVKQIGKLVRSARARRPPQLKHCLPGTPASCAPRRRGRTCRPRRSTFLKAVQPPYVAQCPRGLPAADQWLSARLPFHSAAQRLRPRRESDCSAALQPPRQPTRLPWGSCGPASPARPLPSSSVVPLSPFPLDSLSPFSHFLLLPDLCAAYPASPTPLCLFLLPGFTGSPYPLNPEPAKCVRYLGQGRVSCRIQRQREKRLGVFTRSGGPENPASAEIQNSKL
ncbi:uncharacterized protein LOC120616900 [Pteropus medius]|uniref:uncharacterized protein LOC120616900 n=1 Tax=Pteropus vampyrus TaxID=132908 RepID=UPI00196B1C72|nr:uncharacterized protein LOC120616900 [Pteropus giganteus]